MFKRKAVLLVQIFTTVYTLFFLRAVAVTFRGTLFRDFFGGDMKSSALLNASSSGCARGGDFFFFSFFFTFFFLLFLVGGLDGPV